MTKTFLYEITMDLARKSRHENLEEPHRSVCGSCIAGTWGPDASLRYLSYWARLGKSRRWLGLAWLG